MQMHSLSIGYVLHLKMAIITQTWRSNRNQAPKHSTKFHFNCATPLLLLLFFIDATADNYLI